MSTKPATIPAAEALLIRSLITPTEKGIASRVLARTAGGNLTLFAFDAGQELSEHTAPFDALVLVLEGESSGAVGGLLAQIAVMDGVISANMVFEHTEIT